MDDTQVRTIIYLSASIAPCIQTISPSLPVCGVSTECTSHDSLHPAMLHGMTEMLYTVSGSSEIVDYGFWPNVMRRNFNMIPLHGDLCIDTAIDVVLTVGQCVESVSDSSKIHINQSINH